MLNGLGSPTLTWIPPGFPGYDAEEKRWGFDPEAAKKALAESSYGSVDKLPPITLTFSDTPRNRKRWEWLAAKWKEVLGVRRQAGPGRAHHLHVADQGHQDRAADLHPRLVRRLPGCAELAERLLEDRRLRRAHRLLQRGIRQAGERRPTSSSIPPSALQLYAEAQKLLTDGAPVAFAWNNVNNYLVKPWVKGIVTTPQDSDFPGSTGGVTQIDIDTAVHAEVST